MPEPSEEWWLNEPSAPDDTFARRGEHTLDWLARSTSPRAHECRVFLNKNLSALPPKARAVIVMALRERWHSAFFELIVARLLQELGASIEVENNNSNNRQPDFKAQFEDGAVTVEAVSPLINMEMGEEAKKRIPLLNIVETHVPEGWYVGVSALPDLGPTHSKKQFRRAIQRMLDIAPPPEGASELELVEHLPEGSIHLHLWPASPGKHGQLAMEPALVTWDNSEARIRYAVKQKRRQVRNSPTPVLLAVHGSGIGTEYEEFNTALFGHTYERANSRGEIVETGFHPDGEFTYNLNKSTPSTYAGVLAFLEVGFSQVTEPVLYLHPRFDGDLPDRLLTLQQRSYDIEAGIIRSKPAGSMHWLKGLSFVPDC